MHLRIAWLAALALTPSLSSIGCGGRRPAAPPSIVLISVDTLRSDRLPAYGYARGETPAIDRLAADGILFERAFAHVPLTLPSHASLFTGLLPPAHGARDNVGFQLPGDAGKTLAQRLSARGYISGGAASSYVLRGDTGIGRGFDRWDAPDNAERPAPETWLRLRPWLTEWQRRPFLAFFHLYEPHAPYRPAPDLAARFADPYDGEIATADRTVGELLAELDRLDLYDSAMIALLSDHGEGLGDHGEEEHGFLLYREAIQVPLIVKLPGGQRAGERVGRAVGLIDLLPTLLAAADADPDPTLPGHDLLGPAPSPSRPVYAETWSTYIHFGWSELLSAIDGRFHYIDSPRPELYDLDADPAETENLLELERRAGAALREYLAGFPRELTPPESIEDEETLAKLGALGYLGGAPPPAAASDGPRPNPRDELPRVAPILRGMRLVHEGSHAEAVALLEPAVAAHPDALLGWQYLGRALEALGRQSEAKAAFARTLRGAERESFLSVSAALRLIELGRTEEALRVIRHDLEASPGNADLRVVESRALLVLGRLEPALGAANAAVTANPKLADARYQRAVVGLALGRADAAESDLREAIRLEPRHLQATKALAVLRFRRGDPAEARQLLERVLTLAPEDPDAREGLDLLRREGT